MPCEKHLLAGLLLLLCAQGCSVDSGSSLLDELELPDLGWGDDDPRGLEVPPDLDVPTRKSAYDVVSARNAGVDSPVLPTQPGVRLRSEANIAWLAVGASPEALWPHLVDFWENSGFGVADENMRHGYVETTWRERRLNDPAGIRIRDMFRMRVEREPDAVTNIYLANRKAEFVGGEWRAIFGDLETEIGVLRGLADYLQVATGDTAVRIPPLEHVETELDIRNFSGVPVLTIGQSYSHVWRSLGVTLDRAALKVRRADRSRGIYLVAYGAGGDDGSPPRRRLLQVRLLSKGDRTLVTVHNNRRREAALGYETAYSVLQRIVQGYRLRA